MSFRRRRGRGRTRTRFSRGASTYNLVARGGIRL